MTIYVGFSDDCKEATADQVLFMLDRIGFWYPGLTVHAGIKFLEQMSPGERARALIGRHDNDTDQTGAAPDRFHEG